MDHKRTKKTLKRELKAARQQLEYAQREVALERRRRADVESAANEMRDRLERVLATPEVKADTEAAFLRGHNQARHQFLGWLQSGINALEVDLTKNNDKETSQ
ncbi:MULTISPECIES: hypothetical protein [Streptosporangium]|uniref:Aminopeptidase n=1 Tax=Streptosporangium brasiliense TaxID=47480 RepID=A0ABT9RM87_9ACTN|nr:hypothetical protein [Streptosporangium brasiliense]MDP9870404.1 putative aminopeptidase [Streptosporangium brasiliense]